MKVCEVFERKGKLLVQTSSRTSLGVWVLDGDVAVLAAGVPPDEIGSTVLRALARSSVVPHPTSWDHLTTGLLSAAGVRSWRTFSKGTRSVSVELDNEVVVTPSRNLGAVDGFEPLSNLAIRLSADAPVEQLGRTVRDGLEASTV